MRTYLPKLVFHLYCFFLGYSITEIFLHENWYPFTLAMYMLGGGIVGHLVARLQIYFERKSHAKAECYLTVRFTCSCGEQNSIHFGTPICCRRCKNRGNDLKLLNIPQVVAEFICDHCGRINPVLGEIIEQKKNKIEDEADFWKPEEEREGLVITTTINELPTHSKCRYCKSKYHLAFIEPEDLSS